LPFEAESPTQVVLAHLTQAPRDPREVAPERNIPEPLVVVVFKALSKDQNDRYTDSDDLSSALESAMAAIEKKSNPRPSGTATVRCPSCGAVNPASQKYCGECGAATTSTQLTTIPARRNDPPPRTEPAPPGDGSAAEQAAASERTRPGALRFIGRHDDLAWLETRRAEARSLTGARVVGDVGIGKTRLVREFLDVAAAAGDVVVQCGPDPAWAEVGYWALKRAVVRLASLPETGGTSREWVAATPEARRGLEDVFGHESPDRASSLSPDERRFAAAEALRWAFVRASERARGHRVVLMVDDLHCVDGASRNAFTDTLSDPPLVPALLIATYTPGFDPGWPSDVSTARVLTGLPTAEVAKVIAQATRPSTPSFSAARTILPLYLEQLLRYTREESGDPPAGLADVIAVRVERLPADARRVLQAAAVWGDDGDDEVLTRMLGGEVDLVEALGFLRRAGMIIVGDKAIRTSHPLLREVTLATIPAAVRRELHATAAVICDERELPIEVRALHECYGGTAFQALLLL
ncbi:MAG TPA: AAA family ATPase, partial [Polyangiaceae bacterium]